MARHHYQQVLTGGDWKRINALVDSFPVFGMGAPGQPSDESIAFGQVSGSVRAQTLDSLADEFVISIDRQLGDDILVSVAERELVLLASAFGASFEDVHELVHLCGPVLRACTNRTALELVVAWGCGWRPADAARPATWSPLELPATYVVTLATQQVRRTIDEIRSLVPEFPALPYRPTLSSPAFGQLSVSDLGHELGLTLCYNFEEKDRHRIDCWNPNDPQASLAGYIRQGIVGWADAHFRAGSLGQGLLLPLLSSHFGLEVGDVEFRFSPDGDYYESVRDEESEDPIIFRKHWLFMSSSSRGEYQLAGYWKCPRCLPPFEYFRGSEMLAWEGRPTADGKGAFDERRYFPEAHPVVTNKDRCPRCDSTRGDYITRKYKIHQTETPIDEDAPTKTGEGT